MKACELYRSKRVWSSMQETVNRTAVVIPTNPKIICSILVLFGVSPLKIQELERSPYKFVFTGTALLSYSPILFLHIHEPNQINCWLSKDFSMQSTHIKLDAHNVCGCIKWANSSSKRCIGEWFGFLTLATCHSETTAYKRMDTRCIGERSIQWIYRFITKLQYSMLQLNANCRPRTSSRPKWYQFSNTL